MTTDLDQRLADLRLVPSWPADERAAVLEQVLSTGPVPQRGDRGLILARTRPRRRTVIATAVALVAAACIAVPAVVPAGSPGSADRADAVAALHHLAHVAAVSPADRLGPNQYLHVVDVEHQNPSPGQPAARSRFEDWIRADGLTWQRRTESDGSGVAHQQVWLLPAGPQTIDGMTSSQYLDRLPTDPAALESYVREHTTGSTSADERVFVAVTDIVRRGLATPKLRSAAIDVLAHLGHVQLGTATRDSLGHPVQAFDFVDPNGRPDETKTVMFDTRTAQITEEHDYFHGKLFFTRTVPTFEVVDTVPVSVRNSAIPQK